MTITEQIIKVLQKAASIKDKIDENAICSRDLKIYYGKKKGYSVCIKCYGYQPERSKREDSQKCEMRCSEHCGNTVKEVR